jgi:hypothetical protein
MVTVLKERWLTVDKCYRELVALNADTVDVAGMANGSMIYIMDTSKYYCFDETAQVFREVGGSGTWPATEPTRTVVFEEQTVTINDEKSMIAEEALFDVGVEYIVTVGGTEYDTIGCNDGSGAYLLGFDGNLEFGGVGFYVDAGATCVYATQDGDYTIKIESLGATTKYLSHTIEPLNYISAVITDPSEYVGESVDAKFSNANFGMVSDAIYDDNGTPTFDFTYTKTGDTYYGTIIYYDGTESATEPYSILHNTGAPVGCYLYIPSKYGSVAGLVIGVPLPN